MSETKPTIRVLHHLARTGGTLISRCLASMRGVTLLSEMHPRGSEVALQFDPLFQAQYWFKLLSAAEVEGLRASKATFPAQIEAIRTSALEHGESLVLRDWNHADFMARPVFEQASERFALAEALEPNYRVLRMATVRHPMAQWLSWDRYQPNSGLTIEAFMHGCRRFAEEAVEIGFVRYEDFLSDTGTHLREIAEGLELEYDDQYAYRWNFYRTLTGDVGNLNSHDIAPPRPIEVDSDTKSRIEANVDYQRTIELLRYTPKPDPSDAVGLAQERA